LINRERQNVYDRYDKHTLPRHARHKDVGVRERPVHGAADARLATHLQFEAYSKV
jgi:hypothetical protein